MVSQVGLSGCLYVARSLSIGQFGLDYFSDKYFERLWVCCLEMLLAKYHKLPGIRFASPNFRYLQCR